MCGSGVKTAIMKAIQEHPLMVAPGSLRQALPVFLAAAAGTITLTTAVQLTAAATPPATVM
jgi:hypothetical protein